MYRIKFIPEKFLYQIHSRRDGAFEGDLKSITIKAIQMGLDQSELDQAYRTMNKNKDTVAEFGINGTFMYSHKGEKIDESI